MTRYTFFFIWYLVFFKKINTWQTKRYGPQWSERNGLEVCVVAKLTTTDGRTVLCLTLPSSDGNGRREGNPIHIGCVPESYLFLNLGARWNVHVNAGPTLTETGGKKPRYVAHAECVVASVVTRLYPAKSSRNGSKQEKRKCFFFLNLLSPPGWTDIWTYCFSLQLPSD